MKQTRPYDVYHDPNVPEVVQCRPLLERFIVRIEKLLEEWPEHPTLKQVGGFVCVLCFSFIFISIIFYFFILRFIYIHCVCLVSVECKVLYGNKKIAHV